VSQPAARFLDKLWAELTRTAVPPGDVSYRGELKGIHFIAQSVWRTEQWFAINCGQFDSMVGELLDPYQAQQLMSTLRRGVSISLPGSFQAEQFASGFIRAQRFRFR
jgi:hypothetical protein